MIPRLLQNELLIQLKEYPIVTVLGPRQAGKTTLVRSALPDYTYVSLEDPDERRIAIDDPRAFLRRYPSHVIFDEVQRAPTLVSYLQGIVDDAKINGQFVLTGSHQLQLRETITQSLAGRTGILHLLPLSIRELRTAHIQPKDFESSLFQGFLPRVHAENQRPHIAYANYYQTYVERDVRQLIRLKDASVFEKFMRLLAGRVGQVINYQSLSNDVGVDAKTIKQWISILEASYVVFALPPYFDNFGKRVIKSPKYYFTDTGLLCYLLGIETTDQVSRDPLVGNLFENLVVLEALKARYNQGLTSMLYFYRDSQGHEIDLLYPAGGQLTGIEIKSSSTWTPAFKKALMTFSNRTTTLSKAAIVYSGKPMSLSDGIEVIHYADTDVLFQ
mgnify:CR=1 FL=1